MLNSDQAQNQKKVYSKPLVTEVQLVAEEAVLGNCKIQTGTIDDCVPGNVNCFPLSAPAS